ncbi:MAG: hypothetical protein AB1635_07015 [Acidobacteriota bacterium]
MTKKTRNFVLASGAILAVGLTTGLVASFMGLPVSVFSRAAGPDELQYVPADAAVVAYADVRQVMNSEFRERFRRIEPDTRERDEFERQTGVNIEEDIHSVVAAVMPRPEGDRARGPEQSILVLARGRFEQGRIERLALDHGGTVEQYNGATLVTTRDEHTDAPEMALGFLAADLIAFGTYDAIKNAVDAGRGAANVASNTDLMRQIGELDGSSAWAVGRFDTLTRSARLPNELQERLPALTWFSVSGHVNGGVRGVFKAEARDEEAAQNMRDVLQGFLALGRLQAGSNPAVRQMIDSLQLSGEGTSITLGFSVPTEVLDALEALAQAHQGAAVPRP